MYGYTSTTYWSNGQSNGRPSIKTLNNLMKTFNDISWRIRDVITREMTISTWIVIFADVETRRMVSIITTRKYWPILNHRDLIKLIDSSRPRKLAISNDKRRKYGAIGLKFHSWKPISFYKPGWETGLARYLLKRRFLTTKLFINIFLYIHS